MKVNVKRDPERVINESEWRLDTQALDQWNIFINILVWEMNMGMRSVLIRWVEAACSGWTCIRKQSVSRTNYFFSLCSLGTLEEAVWWKGEGQRLWVQVPAQLSSTVGLWASHLLSSLDLIFPSVKWSEGGENRVVTYTLAPRPAPSSCQSGQGLLSNWAFPSSVFNGISSVESETMVCCYWQWWWYSLLYPWHLVKSRYSYSWLS